jgi:hypothetical protein
VGDGWWTSEAWRYEEDGSARPASPTEGDEGGVRMSAREKKGRPCGLAEGHWASSHVGRRWGEGRWATTGPKTRDGPDFKKKFFSNFN